MPPVNHLNVNTPDIPYVILCEYWGREKVATQWVKSHPVYLAGRHMVDQKVTCEHRKGLCLKINYTSCNIGIRILALVINLVFNYPMSF